MQTAEQARLADEEMRKYLEDAEKMRREYKTVDTGPVSNAGILDYSASGNAMENAMSHLRESIPNGQRQRTKFAWLAMKEGMRQQELWLRERGFL